MLGTGDLGSSVYVLGTGDWGGSVCVLGTGEAVSVCWGLGRLCLQDSPVGDAPS